MTTAKPADLPWMVPYLAVADVARSVEFYQAAFGCEHLRTLKGPDGEVAHARLQYHDLSFMIGTANTSRPGEPRAPLGETPARLGGTGFVIYCFTGDVDAFYERAIEAGATDGYPPDDVFWGDRVCLLFDPDGHAWNFATRQFDYDG